MHPLTSNRHMFFVTEKSRSKFDQSIDGYGDSFARDVDVDELRQVKRS